MKAGEEDAPDIYDAEIKLLQDQKTQIQKQIDQNSAKTTQVLKLMQYIIDIISNLYYNMYYKLDIKLQGDCE